MNNLFKSQQSMVADKFSKAWERAICFIHFLNSSSWHFSSSDRPPPPASSAAAPLWNISPKLRESFCKVFLADYPLLVSRRAPVSEHWWWLAWWDWLPLIKYITTSQQNLSRAHRSRLLIIQHSLRIPSRLGFSLIYNIKIILHWNSLNLLFNL